MKSQESMIATLSNERFSILYIVRIGLLVAAFSLPCAALLGPTTQHVTSRGYFLSTLVPSPSMNIRLFGEQERQQQLQLETNKDDYEGGMLNDVSTASTPPQEPLKELLLSLATLTKRGFVATSDQRSQISDTIAKLSKCNPTTEPATAYYDRNSQNFDDDNDTPTLAGKWTLVYTDAPDITGLDPTMAAGIPSFLPQNAKLGRIGQECIPEESLIKNVIEWKRPDWIQGILNQVGTEYSDGDESRVLQKVCCEATASPNQPTIVELKLAGFELIGDVDDDGSLPSNGIISSLQDYAVHGPAAWFRKNPLNLNGPLKAPFGQFELMYLDHDMRIIKTGQGFFAVNIRQEAWF